MKGGRQSEREESRVGGLCAIDTDELLRYGFSESDRSSPLFPVVDAGKLILIVEDK